MFEEKKISLSFVVIFMFMQPCVLNALSVLVLCEACKERHTGGLLAQGTEPLPGRVASYMLMPYTLPVKAAYSLTKK